MRKTIKTLSFVLLLQFTCLTFCSCKEKSDVDPDSTDNPNPSPTEHNGGYLFAHMTDADYGKLFYSVSRDGLKWQTLNNSEVILSDYVGHPDICKGGDGNYYMIGVRTNDHSYATLYYSSDLVTWRRKDLNRKVFDCTHLGLRPQEDDMYIGAPKMFYDEASKQYIITWHNTPAGLADQPSWEGMRTCYILTSDFKTYTPAERLFDFSGDDEDMATIDVIIRKVEDTYYAIIKDERWPDKTATGKTIRIATSANLTGPYSNPGPSITPSWVEAPTIVQSMDNKEWHLYVEAYTQTQYKLFTANSLADNIWTPVEMTPPVARHGFVLKVDEEQYNNIVKAYTRK